MIWKCLTGLWAVVLFAGGAQAEQPQHVILMMADDMGWGQTGYYDHPALKTPHLDSMAQAGLRFDRFYAGAPNCSPTRATVLTGRTNDRTGVLNHGVPLRPQEKTIAQAMQRAGFATGHFGKWHLNGLRGPGAPILADDPRHPGAFGFDEWLSVTNFFDRNPILSRQGKFEEFTGDSSEIVVAEALKFIQSQLSQHRQTFTVIWFGTPHSPFMASEKDKAHFPELRDPSQSHYAELVAMDRSVGTLRKRLQEMGIAEQTLFWFCSDNGGLKGIQPGTVGDLRGFKGSVYEGGLRVPCLIEWPAGIPESRITNFPACTMDIFPTLVELFDLPQESMLRPVDGISLVPLFSEDLTHRSQPIGFRHTGRAALIDNEYKILTNRIGSDQYELYHVVNDRPERKNLMKDEPEVARRMIAALAEFNRSVDASVSGRDYPEQAVIPPDPGPRTWTQLDAYRPYLDAWKDRPEFRRYLK